MSIQRIGELLSKIVPLTGHDIDEVLHEQSTMHGRGDHQPFGDIALALGLCRPEHVWKALCGQLEHAPRSIDLETFGIDTQATAFLSAETAHRLRVIPVRVFGEFLIVAIDEVSNLRELTDLPALSGRNVRFVIADSNALRRAIDTYYPALQAAG